MQSVPGKTGTGETNKGTVASWLETTAAPGAAAEAGAVPAAGMTTGGPVARSDRAVPASRRRSTS